MTVTLPPKPNSLVPYVDWVLTHDAGAEPAARELMEAAESGLFRTHEKPGRFLDDMTWRARRLPPAHLPPFWDSVAHRMSLSFPKQASRAYALARKAERDHALPVDTDRLRENVLLFARAGALPAKELTTHQRRLAATLPPERAHQETIRLLEALAASPGDLPADLAKLIRSSARAAGLGTDEEARLLGVALRGAHGKAVPNALLDAAAAVMAKHPQDDAVQAVLLDLFPPTRADSAPWVRLLLRCGAAESVAAGRITPDGGLSAWLSRFAREYAYRQVPYGGVSRQPMPPELFELLALFAPRLRAAGEPVRLHETKWRHLTDIDADLLDACLAEGIEVHDPGETVLLQFWGDRSRRDLKAVAAHPVFGRRLEGTVHEGLHSRERGGGGGGTAISRLPGNEGIAAEVLTRINSLLDALRGGGLGAAHEAVDELTTLLDRPTATALDGIEEALASLDLTGPLTRALRAGLPEELGWPALEDALTELPLAEVTAVTCTWPVLTLYSRDRAIAVDHAGRRASCTYRVPDDATLHTVHYVGGKFLVGWTTDTNPYCSGRAFWADAPDEVFEPENVGGMVPYGGSIDGALGFQFETADGDGRHDGERVLRPGGREGIDNHELQMSDGKRVWSAQVYGDDWARVDPVTGARTEDTALPDFPGTGTLPPGTAVFKETLSLAPMPPGAPESPLGQAGSLVGYRVLFRTKYRNNAPDRFVLEGIDGREAAYRVSRQGQDPWGILRLPEGGEDGVLAEQINVRCAAVEDGSLLWEVRGFPDPKHPWHKPSAAAGPMPFPPPAYWHFLVPRDPAASAALRAVDDETVRRLLDSPAGLTDVLLEVMPELTDPDLRDGVLRAVRLAADVRRRREELSRRAGVMRSAPAVTLKNPVPDTELTTALRGLRDEPVHYKAPRPQPQPAMLTALAADGRHLRGEIDDETRRLAPAARPVDWTVLLGSIDAVAWRALMSTTADSERACLLALLETWREQPFAAGGSSWRTGQAPASALAAHRAEGWVIASGPPDDPGVKGDAGERFVQRATDPAPAEATGCMTVTLTRDDCARLTRLLELLAARGPLPLSPAALEAFSRRTGARRAISALTLGGLPYGAGKDYDKLLRSAPYNASQSLAWAYGEYRLGSSGRLAILAAGLPDDPAELPGVWTEDGMVAAAERMADAWTGRVGRTPHVDEHLADGLETDLGITGDWAHRLATGQAIPAQDKGFTLAEGSVSGHFSLHRDESDGTTGSWIHPDDLPHVVPATALAWALTERPVGDPSVTWATGLYEDLRTLLDSPTYLIPLALRPDLAASVATDPSFKPYEGRFHVRSRPYQPGGHTLPSAYDNGSLVVTVPNGNVFLRASTPDVTQLYTPDGGLARMVRRAATTPVPPGSYEANPLLSVPALVGEVATALSLDEDAAALHLQLLTLAHPTDRNIRRWNAWSPARHKAAQSALATSGLTETGKRPRAGRTAFIPGPWTDLKTPHLPLETAKLTPYAAPNSNGKDMYGPFCRLLSPLPLHELFTQAWAKSPSRQGG
ncbi:hypothetical protein IQ62_20845 [Streptomyces scabiei]|uniref:hypothetical protein n=1 Tax=Streptomyces scabiei TaxID=1930 RepID=UPI0004E7191E|nr:hypothetical protein [Streptomyces scabiei]KFF99132.1 hypothetical protein IQ62_20845 [Streptomyces scabiei]